LDSSASKEGNSALSIFVEFIHTFIDRACNRRFVERQCRVLTLRELR
jgi:hypothetical protein